MPFSRFELETFRLQGECSTAELKWLYIKLYHKIYIKAYICRIIHMEIINLYIFYMIYNKNYLYFF